MVQALLLHSDVKTTLRLYAQGVTKIESLLKGESALSHLAAGEHKRGQVNHGLKLGEKAERRSFKH